jgi:hypothetical protein
MCFVWWLGNNDPIIDMHMDDLIVIGARTEDINNLKHEMTAHFRMSDQASSSTLRLKGNRGVAPSRWGRRPMREAGGLSSMAGCKSCNMPLEEQLKPRRTTP